MFGEKSNGIKNTSGRQHYMAVNIDRQFHEIKRKVDRGEYFVMNPVRQYGKTITLSSVRLAYYGR